MKIQVRLVYDAKHHGRHKSRLVADGHLTDIPVEIFYSGVFSLRGIRLLVFLVDINKIEAWATYIGNSYLESNTLEKVYIILIVPAQDVHFFYMRSRLSALKCCAFNFLTNFQFIFTLK